MAVRALDRQFAAATVRREMLDATPEAEWPARQFAALQARWRDAVADVPYYTSLVETGQAPRELSGWDDLRSIPPLTRRVLQDQATAFHRRSGPPMATTRTAGSTGVPIVVGMNQAERDLMRVVKVGSWQAFGYTPDSKLFLIWGHSHLLGTGWRGRVNHAKRKLSDAVLGYYRVDAYKLSRDICRGYAAEIARLRPLGVIGYAAALDLFARHTADLADQLGTAGVRFVLATAEAPPRADTISRLEGLFKCAVVQEYGGAEFGQVAFKNGDEPFAVYPDLNFVETQGRDPADASAERLLVTSLYPRYLPLIRYEVGDAVKVPRTLANGHVASFAAMAGRVNDVIAITKDESIHSVALFHCIHQEPAVHTIQVVAADGGWVISLVAGDTEREAAVARIRRRLVDVHPALGAAEIRFVDDLETNRAGKRRWFVDKRTAVPA